MICTQHLFFLCSDTFFHFIHSSATYVLISQPELFGRVATQQKQ